MRKGISPLIAAVLLIAFTMAVAGIAGPYLTQVMKKSTSGQQEQAEDVLKASKAGVKILDATYSSSTNELNVTIQNTGSVPLKNYTVTAFGEDSNQTVIDEQLNEMEIKTVTLTTSRTPDNIQVQSNNLPVSAKVSGDNLITGAAPAAPTNLQISS